MAHILVVNDSPEFLQLMRDFLTEEGYQVSTLENAADVPDAARRLRPDLLIVDLRMPKMDGLELLSVLQRDPRTASIPVLVSTAALHDLEAKKSVFEDRGIPVLVKPFDLEELLQTLRDMLGKQCSGKEPQAS
jgi:DNA-binding response OmpR family regulator